METLNFTKQGDFYQAGFIANNDYSLHIEREDNGEFIMMQRTGDDGEFVQCGLPSNLSRGGKNIDYSFSHLVYPVNVRIMSASKVKLARRQEAE